jgi:hypothetical protein
MTAHYGVKLLLMIAWTERSRSSGIGAHHRVDYATDAANDYRIKEEPMFAEASLAAWVL